MEITHKDLEFDEDFLGFRAEELGLFQLRLKLPKGYNITGFTFDNRILIRRNKDE